jgi:hypothetical protein
MIYESLSDEVGIIMYIYNLTLVHILLRDMVVIMNNTYYEQE